MPLDGNGQYLLPAPEFPAIPHTQIEAAKFNAIMLDLAGALSQAFYRDGQAGMTGDLPMAGKEIRGVSAVRGETLKIIATILDLTTSAQVLVPTVLQADSTNKAASTEFVRTALQALSTSIEWQPDVFYPAGTVVWSPLTFQQYRRAVSGAGSVDPSLDIVNWSLITFLVNFQVGDYLETARIPDSSWLRRDGGTYKKVDYPELAPLMPEPPVGVAWTPKGASGLPASLNRFAPPLWDAENSQYALFTFKTVSASGQPLCKFTSPTGEVWTEEAITGPVPASDGAIWVVEGNGSVVFFLRGTTPYLGYSMDWGSTWQVASTPPPAPNIARSLCWDPDGERFLLTTDDLSNSNARLWSSPTGAVWTLLGAISAIEAGMGAFGSRAGGGKIFVSDAFGGRYISHNQGTTFETLSPPAGETTMTMPFYYGSGFAFACGDRIYTTTDFVTYKLVVPASTIYNINFSAYGGGVVTAVGDSALAYSLDDGVTWFVTTITGTGAKFSIGDPTVASGKFYVASTIAGSPAIEVGIRSDAGSFLVPSDNPTIGWIKAKNI